MNPAWDAAAASIRVLVADDDRPFLNSLRELVDRQPELEVVATAVDGFQAIELAEDLEPDAVVLDLHMPLLDGVATAARFDDAPPLHQAVREAGADEVLLKNEILDVLVERLTGARAAAKG